MNVTNSKAVEFLLARGNLPILYWLKRDILEVPAERELKNLEKYAARIRILETQNSNGSWCKKRPVAQPCWEKTYNIIETLKNLQRLYDYGGTLELDGIRRAVDFLFSTQTRAGDFRGIYPNDYSPSYQALALEILCRFGLDKDRRIQRGFRWILKNRQENGGWGSPSQRFAAKSRSFSRLVTGMVLRALAESPTWRRKKEGLKAGELMLGHFFTLAKVPDAEEVSSWEKMSYPYWSADILSSLDALSKLGFQADDHANIGKALDWLLGQQNKFGFWESGNKKASSEDHLWVTLAVLKVLKRFGVLEG
jgi:hypothetical protein